MISLQTRQRASKPLNSSIVIPGATVVLSNCIKSPKGSVGRGLEGGGSSGTRKGSMAKERGLDQLLDLMCTDSRTATVCLLLAGGSSTLDVSPSVRRRRRRLKLRGVALPEDKFC